MFHFQQYGVAPSLLRTPCRLRGYTLAAQPIHQEKYQEKYQPQLHKSVGKSVGEPFSLVTHLTSLLTLIQTGQRKPDSVGYFELVTEVLAGIYIPYSSICRDTSPSLSIQFPPSVIYHFTHHTSPHA